MHGIVLRGAIVEPESLLVYVAKQVERLYRNVGAAKSTLEKRPEVFESLSVNLPVNVLLKDDSRIDVGTRQRVRHRREIRRS
jgi:hypothetical protein